jgi:hypothetical protein
MADGTPAVPDAPEVPVQQAGALEVPNRTEGPTAPSSGGRPAFREIQRQLSDEELQQTGVQKLLLDNFERADSECVSLREYVEKYHKADKENEALRARLKTNVAMEILTAAGVAAGSSIISLAPSLFPAGSDGRSFGVAIGLVLLLGSAIGRYVQVKK